MKNEITKAQYTSLKRKYPGQYIALLDSKVISSGNTFKEVMDKTKGKDLRRIILYSR